MLAEDALRQILISNVGVTSLTTADRIFPNVLDQDTEYPALCYRLRSREHPMKLELRGSIGMAKSRYAIFSAAETYDEVKAVDEAVRLALQGYQAVVTVGLETLEVMGIFPLTSVDFYDDSTGTHQVMSEYDVHHEEVQPT